MNDLEYESTLVDRIAKIQAINEQYDLEHNAYLSFSGGKDSVILSHLLDIALPNNHIPRVYANTGIDYKFIREFVKECAFKDTRIKVLNSGVNLKKMWETDGYPFKSKQHSLMLSTYWNTKDKNEYNLTIKTYLGIVKRPKKFKCPKMLEYQFTPNFNLKCSDKCCARLKKIPMKKWAKENNKPICLTGMRKEEGGQRTSIGCIVTDNDNKLVKFHPLLVVTEEWENEFVERERIELCKLYKPPYNFKRTGCKGCPFDLNIQETLNTMYKLLPNEYYQCLHLWKPVYDEYIRIGFRLKYYPHERGVQMNLFDYISEE